MVAGAVALAVWVWKGMIRATYIPTAPGIIQVLIHRPLGNRPSIRSYPMEPGTSVVFPPIRKRLTVLLARDEDSDVLSFGSMCRPQEQVEQARQASLSSAPTPPLSRAGLLG